MQRCLLIVLAFAACAKSRDGSPASAPAAEPAAQPGASSSAEPASPTVTREQALEAARTQASLGASAQTSAFDPLPDDGAPIKAKAKGGATAAKADERAPVKAAAAAPSETASDAAERDAGDHANESSGGPRLRGPGEGTAIGAAQPPPALPEVSVEAVTLADGAPAPVALTVALRRAIAGVEACYTHARAKRSDIAGSLRVRFTVGTTGALSAASVESSTVNERELDACVIRVVDAIKLGEPLGTAPVTAAVTFRFGAR